MSIPSITANAARYLFQRTAPGNAGPAQEEVRALAHRTLLVLPPGTHHLRSLYGDLWVTQDGDLRDTVLEAGQSMQTAERGHTVVYALSDARLLLRAGREQPARLSGQPPRSPAHRPAGMALG